MDTACAICKKSIEEGQDVSLIGDKGSNAINHKSSLKGDNITTQPGQPVHKVCRRDYINKRQSVLTLPGSFNSPRSLRSTTCVSFDYRNKCLFCSTDAKITNRKRGHDVFQVRTLDFQKAIVKKCEERNDNWSMTVLGRIENIIDLPAADAVYHQTCNVNFRTGRSIPKPFQSDDVKKILLSVKSPGRPINDTHSSAFSEIVTFIEQLD